MNRRISVTLDVATIERLEAKAREDGIARATLARKIIEKALPRIGRPPKAPAVEDRADYRESRRGLYRRDFEARVRERMSRGLTREAARRVVEAELRAAE